MASRTEQLKIQREAFFRAAESGNARMAKILFSDALIGKDADQAKIQRVFARSLMNGPELFEHCFEKIEPLLLTEKFFSSPSDPGSPPCDFLAMVKDAFKFASSIDAQGELSLARPETEAALSASCGAVFRWLSPLLAKRPEWRASSLNRLPGVFWSFLPEQEREAALNVWGTPEIAVQLAASSLQDAILLDWPAAFAKGERQLDQALARVPPENQKGAKAYASRQLLRMAAEAGPCPDLHTQGNHWAPQIKLKDEGGVERKIKQAKIRPALIEAALARAAALAPLQWAKLAGAEAKHLSTPLALAAKTLNVVAWDFMRKQKAPPKASDKALTEMLEESARNWSALPPQAAQEWAAGDRANPNAAFDHANAPWAALGEAAIQATSMRSLASMYWIAARAAVKPAWEPLPQLAAPSNSMDSAQSLARFLFRAPNLLAEACERLVFFASEGKGFSSVEQPALLSDWLLPALIKEGAPFNPQGALASMDGPRQAALSAFVLELELSRARPESESAAPRAPTRRL